MPRTLLILGLAVLLGLGATQALGEDAAKAEPLPRYEKRSALFGHGSLVRCVAFRPGTHILASGGSDRSLRLWDTDKPQADKGASLGSHTLPRGG